jgi:hypothetical protein
MMLFGKMQDLQLGLSLEDRERLRLVGNSHLKKCSLTLVKFGARRFKSFPRFLVQEFLPSLQPSSPSMRLGCGCQITHQFSQGLL